MGNVEAAVVRNVDKRTSRREHRPTFAAAVQRFRAAPFAAPELPNGCSTASGHSVRVYVRKRPIFPHEVEQGEFDVITCLQGRVVVHDARMHPDMVHMFMNHHDFGFDHAFSETADNDAVYEGTARDLVYKSLDGGSATVMMYGQTGSGKTYTMSAIYKRVATELFAGGGAPRHMSVSFIELVGDVAFDMLNQGANLTLASAADGSCHPYPCVEVDVEDPQELLAIIDMAARMRATAATGVHDQSSRSHAICRIFIETEDGSEGSLTLVDLAGSEHRIDSMEHNAERRKEGARINASLCALKECVRSMAAGSTFIAFRQSKLTQLLRSCFDGRGRHPTVVIATVSPSSKDTEHSLNTLRHACIMDGQGESKAKGSEHMAGGCVTKEKLGEIDVTKIARERRAKKMSQPEAPDEWVKPPPPAHQAKKSNTGARAALDRRCVAALPERIQQALIRARGDFHHDRQRARIARPPPPGLDAAPTPSDEQPVGGRLVAASSGTRKQKQEGSASANADKNDDIDGQPNSAQAAGEGSVGRVPPSDHQRALDLFRVFCRDGRGAREWRKNDLRLISAYVVPILFGDARIEWQFPNAALDDLERLLSEMPPPPHFWQQENGHAGRQRQRAATDSAAQRNGCQHDGGPQRHSETCGSPAERGHSCEPDAVVAEQLGSPASQQLEARQASVPPASKPCEGARRDSVSSSRNEKRKPPAMPPPVGGSAGPSRPQSGASVNRVPTASGGTRTSQQRHSLPRSAPQSGSRPDVPQRTQEPRAHSAEPPIVASNSSASLAPTKTRDDVRARRAKMEEARKRALEEALGKKQATPMSRDDEIADLEQQLRSSSCSAAAASGLKRRIAALRAAAIREQRAAEAARRARQEAISEPPNTGQAAPVVADQPPQARDDQFSEPRDPQAAPEARTPGADARGRVQAHSSQRQWVDDELPEPAVPPPRACNGTDALSHLHAPMHGSTRYVGDATRQSPSAHQAMGHRSGRTPTSQRAESPGNSAQIPFGGRRFAKPMQSAAAAAPWANQFSNEAHDAFSNGEVWP